jgi:hypothetical protein
MSRNLGTVSDAAGYPTRSSRGQAQRPSRCAVRKAGRQRSARKRPPRPAVADLVTGGIVAENQQDDPQNG